MNDREIRQQEARIRKYVRKWRGPLRLTGWELNYMWHPGPYEVNGGYSDEQLASVNVSWPYRRATLSFNLQRVGDHSEEEVEECVVHENVNHLVNEMRQWKDADDALDHEERCTTEIAWAFLGLKDAIKGKR